MAGPCEAPAGLAPQSPPWFVLNSWWSAASGLGLGTSPWSIGAANFDPVGSCQQSVLPSHSVTENHWQLLLSQGQFCELIGQYRPNHLQYEKITQSTIIVLLYWLCHLECPFFYPTLFFFKCQVPIGDIQTGQSEFASHEFAQQLWIQKTSEWLKIGKSNYPQNRWLIMIIPLIAEICWLYSIFGQNHIWSWYH